MIKEICKIDKLCSTSNYTKKLCRCWEIVKRFFKKIQEWKNYSFSDEYIINRIKNNSSGKKYIINTQKNDVMLCQGLKETTGSAILCNAANIHSSPD